MAQLLGLQGSWARADTDCLPRRRYGPSESFFKPLVAGDQKASLARLAPPLRPFRHLEGSLARGPALLFCTSGTEGPRWLGSTLQFDASVS